MSFYKNLFTVTAVMAFTVISVISPIVTAQESSVIDYNITIVNNSEIVPADENYAGFDGNFGVCFYYADENEDAVFENLGSVLNGQTANFTIPLNPSNLPSLLFEMDFSSNLSDPCFGGYLGSTTFYGGFQSNIITVTGSFIEWENVFLSVDSENSLTGEETLAINGSPASGILIPDFLSYDPEINTNVGTTGICINGVLTEFQSLITLESEGSQEFRFYPLEPSALYEITPYSSYNQTCFDPATQSVSIGDPEVRFVNSSFVFQSAILQADTVSANPINLSGGEEPGNTSTEEENGIISQSALPELIRTGGF